MPLHVRSIAVSIAVICFFTLSIIGGSCGLSPFVCCKRALIGAILAYIVGGGAVRAINAILIEAMIASQMNLDEETGIGAENGMRLEGNGRGGKDSRN